MSGGGPDDVGTEPDRAPETEAGPAPVASLDGLSRDEPGAGGAAAPVASFDAGRIGAARADVPVAELGRAATRRAGRRLWSVEPGADGAADPPGPAPVADLTPAPRPTRSRRLSIAGTEAGDGADDGGADEATRRPKRRRRDREPPEIAASAVEAARAILERAEQRQQSSEPPAERPPTASGADAHRGRTERGQSRRGQSQGGQSESGEPDSEADPLAVARAICLRLLTERARSRQELAQALRRREVPEEAVLAVLARFGEVGLIDDAAFAEQWVHSRHAGKGLGRRALAVELRRKGVADDLAGEALEEIDSGAEERRARELVDRKLRVMTVDSREERAAAVRRLAGMLARKGYGAGVAYRVVREAIAARGADVEELGIEHLDD